MLLNAWEQVHEVLQKANGFVSVSITGDNKHTHPVISEARLSRRKLRIPLTPPLSKSGSFSSIQSTSPESPSHSQFILGPDKSNPVPQIVTFTLKDSHVNDNTKKRQLLVSPDPPASPGPLTIYLLSKISGKPQLAQVTRDIAASALSEDRRPEKSLESTFPITPQTLSSLLQSKSKIHPLNALSYVL
jgi:hypothetical protein